MVSIPEPSVDMGMLIVAYPPPPPSTLTRPCIFKMIIKLFLRRRRSVVEHPFILRSFAGSIPHGGPTELFVSFQIPRRLLHQSWSTGRTTRGLPAIYRAILTQMRKDDKLHVITVSVSGQTFQTMVLIFEQPNTDYATFEAHFLFSILTPITEWDYF